MKLVSTDRVEDRWQLSGSAVAPGIVGAKKGWCCHCHVSSTLVDLEDEEL